MRFIITGRNIDVTEGLKSAVEEKLGKLDRFFAPETEVNVTLSVEKERQKIEVTIPVKGNIIRSEQVSSDMYVSIDLVEEVIERQLKKYKNKIVSKQQNAAAFAQEFVDKDYDDEDDVKIIRTKRFGIKPMDPEEACVQMERFGSNINEFATSMRAMRRHEIERIGLSWMSGVISDSDSLKAMTDVYDAIIDASLTWAVRHQIAEFGVETAPAGITVIAMGRYGGREVNFSSDADAILIYRPADDVDDGQANAFAKKVVEDLRNILQGPTTLEPKIELDLDLRPEGKNGPLVRSYASCEEYYESWASTWERQALLRARYAAGDAELARDFLINIADPLRYPTTELTEAELQNIRKLKARMEAERLPRGVRRERHLKLGKGGLSDVEWTVQLMQLQHAGDIKDLRVNGTLEALDVLEAKKLISAIDAIQLRKAWTLCTAARNGSYLWSGRANQADILPDDIYSLGGIAVYLGYGAHRGQHFENDLLAVMRKCRDVCQRLFYGKTEGEAAAATTATASAATQQPQTAPRPRMHVIAPRLERNRRRAQR